MGAMCTIPEEQNPTRVRVSTTYEYVTVILQFNSTDLTTTGEYTRKVVRGTQREKVSEFVRSAGVCDPYSLNDTNIK